MQSAREGIEEMEEVSPYSHTGKSSGNGYMLENTKCQLEGTSRGTEISSLRVTQTWSVQGPNQTALSASALNMARLQNRRRPLPTSTFLCL